ncbi:hypothetical protein [Chryseobacterium vrystaatense]|nr:hypothetical protein [Chryseobacterium vrystaatense]
MKKYIFLLLAFLSCSGNSKKMENQNFHFEYWTGEDHYNSGDSIFTRNYEANDQLKKSDSTRKVALSKEEVIKIINEINNSSISDLPDDFSCSILPISDPQFIHFKINNDNKFKEILFSYSRSNPILNCAKAERIINFSKVVDSIIYNKKSIRDLPPTNLYYE